jgi:hypothetical protein
LLLIGTGRRHQKKKKRRRKLKEKIWRPWPKSGWKDY